MIYIQTFQVIVVAIVEMLKLLGLNFHLHGRSLHVLLLHASAGLLHMEVGLLLHFPTVATEREGGRERQRQREVNKNRICGWLKSYVK